ncbi:transcriptional regulator TACO1-like protein [Glomus cerebriforme]|uniref:Transcriptional regulator TACO1-like protein n=1 Tax=Glomus cerebriforme TaxID=658196 RepID=A0A397TVN4_9GLOM|nr:transcriptional regulator TACO1-like protein [Glomus cerebriforme]
MFHTTRSLLSRTLNYKIFPLFSNVYVNNVYNVQKRFSGHNKWSKIRHVKGVKDLERGILFTKLSKEIQLANFSPLICLIINFVRRDKVGGSEPGQNARLAAALASAKKAHMPKDNVENSIKRALGQGKAESIESINYEGYGPGGIAFIIETVTDNKNRTVKDLKHFFAKAGGSMSAVSWMFDKKGTVQFNHGSTQDTLDKMMDNVMEVNEVEDIQELGDDSLEIICPSSSVNAIYEELTKKYNYEVIRMSSEYIPTSTIIVDENDKELVEKLTRFMNNLNDHEDVIKVHNNAE